MFSLIPFEYAIGVKKRMPHIWNSLGYLVNTEATRDRPAKKTSECMPMKDPLCFRHMQQILHTFNDKPKATPNSVSVIRRFSILPGK